jgi:hypothetical protein
MTYDGGTFALVAAEGDRRIEVADDKDAQSASMAGTAAPSKDGG